MAFTNEEQAKMQATAAGPAQPSLAELFAQEYQAYTELKAQSQRQEAYAPTATKNAQAVGDFTDRAPGEAPVAIAQQGQTLAEGIASTIAGGKRNVLDVLTNMLALQKEQNTEKQRAFDRNLALSKERNELNKLGMDLNDDGTVRPLTDEEKKKMNITKYTALSDEDAVTELKTRLGVNDITLGSTGPERGSRARDILARLDAGQKVDYKEYLKEGQTTKISAYQNMVNKIDEAIASLEKGGEQTGFFQSLGFKIKGKLSSFGDRIPSRFKLSEEEATLANNIAQVAGGEAFGDAGKALTETEKSIVDPKIITLAKSEAEVLAGLKAAREKAILAAKSIGGEGAITEKKAEQKTSGKYTIVETE